MTRGRIDDICSFQSAGFVDNFVLLLFFKNEFVLCYRLSFKFNNTYIMNLHIHGLTAVLGEILGK